MDAYIYAENYLRDELLLADVPEELAEELQPGCQVLFSPASNRRKNVIAYILRLEKSRPAGLMADGTLVDVLNSAHPVLTTVTMKLALWIAEYYISRPIEAINALLPAPLKTTVQDIVELCEFQLQSGTEKIVTTTLRKKILRALQESNKPTVHQLERKLGKHNLYRTLTVMERGGLVQLKKKFPQSGPKTRTAYRLRPNLSDEVTEPLKRAPRQAEAVEKMRQSPHASLFAQDNGIARQTLESLVKKGIAEKIRVEIQSSFSTGFTEPKKIIEQLSSAQHHVLKELSDAFHSGSFTPFLLHGVTGSGKTIVYIELLKQVLESGRNAIVLVPEISLTPQTASRFRQHFGDDIQILHSAMSNQEKYDAWQNLRNGKARIALGARSTIFAPLCNVGAIIVDEEHDAAYKQDRTPRYHGRDTAVMRAKLEQAICVLGSATPSFESYSNAEKGKYRLLRLPDRVDNAAMPAMKLVPMLENRRITPSLSEVLYLQIKERLKRDEQVILLQNRRGFAGSVLCMECGHITMCKHCNVPMVYHASSRQQRCHYCGHAVAFSGNCPKCSSANLLYKSSGTERIAEELRELFPEEKILRMDVDTTNTKGSHAIILNAFHKKQARILLGTQMVAKGLDFPDVSLVGVLMADIGLNIPDFRSGERLFSLLMQVAGRAGRAAIPGEVYLQAYNTDNPLFAHLLRGSYEAFYQEEMVSRKELHYPPFTRMVVIEFTSPDETAAEKAASACVDHLRSYLKRDSCHILGPAPAGISRMKGRFRYQVLLKLQGRPLAADYLKHLQYSLMNTWKKHHLSMIIDVDPQSLM
ncbi:primosomal protein N' [Prosthecochloris sp. ZM]|uniref:replication restart helicase PriA n=2 Tax=unclassified Prosthecochloris TaxID=2632826 RepID=UPI000DF78991|nr:primosomal protein N' [Prosthecochloris sp. ZM]RDD30268.1 primosomal protein N' [Prosthecochloris sp. ZM]